MTIFENKLTGKSIDLLPDPEFLFLPAFLLLLPAVEAAQLRQRYPLLVRRSVRRLVHFRRGVRETEPALRDPLLHAAGVGDLFPVRKNGGRPIGFSAHRRITVGGGDFYFFFIFMYDIQHCFICRPSDSNVSEMLESNPGQLRLRHWLSDALTTRLDL